jgi:hypothetical protein
VRDAAGLDDVPEEVQVREVEAHVPLAFFFDEGSLRKTQIVQPT